MRRSTSTSYVILVGLAWAACGAGSIALRFNAGVVQLFWLPSAVSAAALFLAPRRDWRRLLLAIAVGSAGINLWFGLGPLQSLSYILAAVIQPVVTVVIAKWVVGKRRLESLDLARMLLLFLGALTGSVLGALIVFPARIDEGFVLLSWWVTATTLASAVVAPLLIHLHGWAHRYRGDWRAALRSIRPDFVLVQAGLFLLSLWVLVTPYFSLTQLVLASLVFVTARYGLLAACYGVLMFGIAGTIKSIGGAAPAAYLPYTPFVSGVILQGFMLLMLATSFPLASLLMRNDRLTLRLAARNARMRENLLMLGLAEEVGRIGRWRYDPRTGAQDWSRQMFLINGLNPALGRDPGDVKELLPDGGKELFSQLGNHSRDRARYSFEYRIHPPQGEERVLRMYAMNEFTDAGELACMFGVVMDVTEHHQRQEALDKERTRAMRLAAEAQFLAHTDPLTGLANRRRAITQLQKCIRRAEQGQRSLALIAFDIDYFKRINDTKGHQTGDDVLVRVAEIARGQARASDLIGRMGGEEFVWILPDTGGDVARNAAERLRKAIEVESPEGGLPPVTASIGFAIWREGDDANRLLGRADEALYEAKGSGRNAVHEAA